MDDEYLLKKALEIKGAFSLEGKTAIVTGGAKGLGRACALAFAGAGADILIAGKTEANNNKTVQEIESMGGRAGSCTVDVRDELQVDYMVKAAVDMFGGVDILLNSAGIAEVRPVMDFDLKTWQEIMDINVKGVFLCTKAAAKQMLLQKRGGKIINISSLQGFAGRRGDPAYSTSKGAVNLMTKSLACEWPQEGITVNAIAPTWCWTDMTAPTLSNEKFYQKLKERIPMGRAASQEDLMGIAVFLASEASNFINGAVIPLDGGGIACDGFPEAT